MTPLNEQLTDRHAAELLLDTAATIVCKVPSVGIFQSIEFKSVGTQPAAKDLPEFPSVGETISEFRLQEALGSGLNGRVFLAAQTGLANRLVVLKITPLQGREHLLLARLQHTNIVPIHTVFDDPARRIRILCMPYFGRVTLASLLCELDAVPMTSRTGQHVVQAIDRLQQSVPAISGAVRQMLAHVSYVHAMCWIAASLADALHFAHERGLVHLDVKPANILLATEGQPMLLDFHLSRAPILPVDPPPKGLGGTPRYMPPEQQAAMHALRTGNPIPMAVDARADIFSLGVVLYELLGGPVPKTADPPTLEHVNPHVSASLSDIVAKCLADRPEQRYASAASLADDLRRHLTDQPLTGVSNRSVRERWHKWRRRRPSIMRAAVLFALVAATATLLLTGAWLHVRDRRLQAEQALRDGQAQMQNGGHYPEAVQSFQRGLALIDSRPFQGDLPQQLREQLGLAKRLILARQLHSLADEIRGLYGANNFPIERLQSLASSCRTVWEKRTQIVNTLHPTQDPEVAEDLQDIALFSANLEVKLGARSNVVDSHHEALRLLDEAESLVGPSAVLTYERRSYRQALGFDSVQAGGLVPRTAREHYVLGRSHLAAGELPEAAAALQASLVLDPAGRWSNFYFGMCAYRLGRYEDAVAAFSVCIGTAPKSAESFHNRGLAHAALGHIDQAKRDFDRAVQLDPKLAKVR